VDSIINKFSEISDDIINSSIRIISNSGQKMLCAIEVPDEA